MSALEENPEALWSIAQMEVAGHEPDVYDYDDQGFDIGTCSAESPKSSRNCVIAKFILQWSMVHCGFGDAIMRLYGDSRLVFIFV